ncbi:MAG: response regulator transcription factor [Lachnospiraceae bacterium]|nr:response regulator transcription factor [Lachnospiraceae bacterium]
MEDKPYTILVVDDDPDIRWGLYRLLKTTYKVVTCGTGAEGLSLLKTQDIHLCLLDVSLPGENGFAVCRKIRDFSGVPIIMITVNDDETSLEEGITSGADDYVRKPFSYKELSLRIMAQLRRAYHENENVPHEDILTIGPYALNEADHTLTVAGNACSLTSKEYQLLFCLMHHNGCLVTRDLLLSRIWDETGRYVDTNTLTVHMSRLRKKLMKMSGQDPVQTVTGIGYRFSVK